MTAPKLKLSEDSGSSSGLPATVIGISGFMSSGFQGLERAVKPAVLPAKSSNRDGSRKPLLQLPRKMKSWVGAKRELIFGTKVDRLLVTKSS